MELLTNIDQFNTESYVATIGFFDGVHVGHRFLLEQLKKKARELNKKSLVISFDVHPKSVIATDFNLSLLTTNSEKIELLRNLEIDAFVLLHFDAEMATLSAQAFLEKIILKQLGVHTLLVGYDNRFGKNRQEGYEDYVRYGKELGISILPIDSYKNDETHISSTVIRNLLLKGEVDKAAQYLTQAYSLRGRIVSGDKLGSKIGYPTANIRLVDTSKLCPSKGVFAVRVSIKDKQYKGMLNIGTRPTINDLQKQSIEVHILDFDRNIYDETIEVQFIQKIREEQKFSSLDALQAQLGKDKLYVQNLEF